MANTPPINIRRPLKKKEVPNHLFATSGLVLVVAYLIGASSHYSRLDQIKAANLNPNAEATLAIDEETGTEVMTSLYQFFTSPSPENSRPTQKTRQKVSESSLVSGSPETEESQTVEDSSAPIQPKTRSRQSLQPKASQTIVQSRPTTQSGTVRTLETKPVSETALAPTANVYRPPVPLATAELSKVPVSHDVVERVQTLRQEIKQGNMERSPRLQEVRERISTLKDELEGTEEARQVRQHLQTLRNTVARQSVH